MKITTSIVSSILYCIGSFLFILGSIYLLLDHIWTIFSGSVIYVFASSFFLISGFIDFVDSLVSLKDFHIDELEYKSEEKEDSFTTESCCENIYAKMVAKVIIFLLFLLAGICFFIGSCLFMFNNNFYIIVGTWVFRTGSCLYTAGSSLNIYITLKKTHIFPFDYMLITMSIQYIGGGACFFVGGILYQIIPQNIIGVILWTIGSTFLLTASSIALTLSCCF